MEEIMPRELKQIIHSQRTNFYYLEHCKVLVNGGRVEYITDYENRMSYWNIPIANTTVVLLGTGTSITQAAVREMAKAGVLVGFCGSDGAPLYAGCEIEFINSRSEYRPTQYLQNFIVLWIDETKRLSLARKFQEERIKNIKKFWLEKPIFVDGVFNFNSSDVLSTLDRFAYGFNNATDTQGVLSEEAIMTKKLYSFMVKGTCLENFVRAKNGTGLDDANRFLDHGNYLAYGLAACALWVLGIPASLSVVHGKTRKGGLVFDLADVVKDAIVMPTCFEAAVKEYSQSDFRTILMNRFNTKQILDSMIEFMKGITAYSDGQE